MSFRAIISTSGEVCLFSESMPATLCKKIGFAFNEKLLLSETETSAPSQMSSDQGNSNRHNLNVPEFIYR